MDGRVVVRGRPPRGDVLTDFPLRDAAAPGGGVEARPDAGASRRWKFGPRPPGSGSSSVECAAGNGDVAPGAARVLMTDPAVPEGPGIIDHEPAAPRGSKARDGAARERHRPEHAAYGASEPRTPVRRPGVDAAPGDHDPRRDAALDGARADPKAAPLRGRSPADAVAGALPSPAGTSPARLGPAHGPGHRAVDVRGRPRPTGRT